MGTQTPGVVQLTDRYLHQMTDLVYYNGEYLSKADMRVDPDERGWLLGDGVYDVVAAYRGTFVGLNTHVQRLARSQREAGITTLMPHDWSAIAHELLRQNGLDTMERAVVYIQVTRGVAPRAHAFPRAQVPPTVYAYARPFRALHEGATGCQAITVSDTRWSRCDIKSISLMANCMANQRAYEAGAYEAIFVRDGVVLEGTHTNVFAVIDGVVRTAPLTNYLLAGVTRGIILDLCRTQGIIFREATISEAEFRRAEEIFVTGTTTEVLPIVRLDGRPVAMGDVGVVTQRLQQLYFAAARAGTI